MAEISISTEIREKLSGLALGIIEIPVEVKEYSPEIWQEIDKISDSFKTDLSDISADPIIKAARNAYKILGKDPARYRPSAEALRRRVVKELDIPRLNNIVDLINLISLQTGFSIGGYDADKIEGEVTLNLGLKTDKYDAIGRGELNIENLPVLRDNISAFGNPTSDSVRTSVTLHTKNFLMVIFGFSGEADTLNSMQVSAELFKRYAGITNINTFLLR